MLIFTTEHRGNHLIPRARGHVSDGITRPREARHAPSPAPDGSANAVSTEFLPWAEKELKARCATNGAWFSISLSTRLLGGEGWGEGGCPLCLCGDIPFCISVLYSKKCVNLGGVDPLFDVFVNELPLLYDQEAVGDFLREPEHLLRHHYREVAFGLQAIERLGDVLDDRRLDAFGRLVEDQHFRVRHQRAGDGELLLLSAGQIAALAVAHLVQYRKSIVDELGNDLVRHVLHARQDVLLDSEIGKNHAALRHIGH